MSLAFIAPQTVLAPMEGVGHPLFRALIAEKGGLGLVCTEFVRISGERISPKVLDAAVVKAAGLPLSVQVMGRDLELMAEAAAFVEQAGADVVDINLGCPSSCAARGGVGAAMLKDLPLLSRVLVAMRQQVRGRLSAKIRAGFDNREQVLDIVRCVQDAGADFLAIHPRRRTDHYRGVADWRIIERVKAFASIPVIGNGDCWYAKDIARMRAETGCDAVMIGRPALRNPWIFQQADALAKGQTPFAPSGDDVIAYLETVADRYASQWRRPLLVVGKLKELIGFVGRAVPDDKHFLQTARRAPDLSSLLQVARDCLAGVPAERLDLLAEGHLGMELSGSVDAVAPAEAA